MRAWCGLTPRRFCETNLFSTSCFLAEYFVHSVGTRFFWTEVQKRRRETWLLISVELLFWLLKERDVTVDMTSSMLLLGCMWEADAVMQRKVARSDRVDQSALCGHSTVLWQVMWSNHWDFFERLSEVGVKGSSEWQKVLKQHCCALCLTPTFWWSCFFLASWEKLVNYTGTGEMEKTRQAFIRTEALVLMVSRPGQSLSATFFFRVTVRNVVASRYECSDVVLPDRPSKSSNKDFLMCTCIV